MFRNFRLWAKIMLVTGVTVVIVGTVLTVNNLAGMSSLIREAERNALEAHSKAILNGINAQSRMAETMSAVIGSIPLVQEKFAAGDRKALADLFEPGFKQLAKDYGIEQFQFHTPPATSFFRAHLPHKYGDDLSSFRFTVLAANKDLKPAFGLEGGVGGLGVRGVVPVFFSGRHVGSVEFGMSFGQPFFDDFKRQNGVDAGLFLPDKEGFKTMSSTLGKTPLLPVDVLKKAMTGEAQLGDCEINGAPYAVFVTAVNDFSGKPVGVVEIAMDSSRYQSMLSQARTTAIVVGLLSMGLCFVLAMLVARHMVGRINTVVETVNRVAQGDLSVDIPLEGNDEIADLAGAMREMRRKLHDLAAEVSANAAEVYAAAQEIAGAVEGQAATSSEMSSSVAEITSTMEELSASSTQIAGAFQGCRRHRRPDA